MDLDEEGVDAVHIRARQLAAEKKAIDKFRETDFKGSAYELFIERYTSYALGVVGAWVRSGAIFRHCSGRNRQVVLHVPSAWSLEDQEDLTVLTVAVAVGRFHREGIRAGKWSFIGGATLGTYLIGLCLDAFPNEFRAWYRARRRQIPANHLDPEEEVFVSFDDPAGAVISMEELVERLNPLTNRERSALVLTSLGYSLAETASILNTTYGAAANAVYRARKRLERMAERSRDDGVR